MNTSRRNSKLILAVALIAAVVTGAAGAAGATAARGSQTSLDTQLALALTATKKYATNLALARHDGYRIVTRNVPGVGLQVTNPSVRGFDTRKPAVLIYEHQGNTWRLGAVEWVFAGKPAQPPLPGARYGSFRAGSGLVSMRVWLWAANPRGLFASTNPAATYANPLATAHVAD